MDVTGNRVVEVDLSTRTVVHEWLPEGNVWSLALPIALPGGEGRVFVPDPGDREQHRPAGIRVFDRTGHEVTPGPIDVRATPYDLELVP